MTLRGFLLFPSCPFLKKKEITHILLSVKQQKMSKAIISPSVLAVSAYAGRQKDTYMNFVRKRGADG